MTEFADQGVVRDPFYFRLDRADPLGCRRNMKFPFDELHMGDPEHLARVKSWRDPELWHLAAIAVLVYLDDLLGFLVWLFDQPEVDRATAWYIFLGANGREYLREQTEFHGKGLPETDG